MSGIKLKLKCATSFELLLTLIVVWMGLKNKKRPKHELNVKFGHEFMLK